MNKPSPHLDQETKINWLEDPMQYPYVRERTEFFPLRARFPLKQYTGSRYFKLLGYSEISAGAEQIDGGFYRRIWYLKLPNDPFPENAPVEASIPSSIKPRQLSTDGRVNGRVSR